MESDLGYPVYVVHYSKLVKRKTQLCSRLEEFGVKPTWITEKDIINFKISKPTAKRILGVSAKKFGMDLGVTARSLKFSRRHSRIQGYGLLLRSFLSRNNSYATGSIPPQNSLLPQWLELQRMHLTSLFLGIESESDWILVLEDDAIPDKNAFPLIEKITLSKKPGKTWINLNSGAGLMFTKSDPEPDEFGLFRIKPASTRCAVAYLISRELAKSIVSSARIDGIPDFLPIDFYFQLMLRKFKAVAYWQDPPLFLQGSESGEFASNFETFRP
jgi:hypothetical protein